MKKNSLENNRFEMDIEISSELLHEVKSIAKHLNISVNELYCAALDEYIKKQKSKKK